MELLAALAAIIGLGVGLIQLAIWLKPILKQRKWFRKAQENKTDLVAIGITVKGSSVLMVKRAEPEGNLGWQFPAALVDFKQEVYSRITDETFAETGITTKFHRILGERKHPDSQKYVVYAALEYLKGDPQNGQPDENTEVRWVNIKDAKLLLTTNLSSDVANYISLFEESIIAK